MFVQHNVPCVAHAANSAGEWPSRDMPSCSYWSQIGSKAALVEVQARSWCCWLWCSSLWPVTRAGADFFYADPSGRAEKAPVEPVSEESVAHNWHHGWRRENTCFGKQAKDVKEKGQRRVARQVAIFLLTDNCRYDTIPGPNCTPNDAQVSPPEAKRLLQIDVSVPRRWLCFSIIFKNNHCNATEFIKRIKCKYYWNLMQHRHQCDIKVFYQ